MRKPGHLEKYRIKKGLMASTEEDGMKGAYFIRFHCSSPGMWFYQVICGIGLGWEHVSVCIRQELKGNTFYKTPSWDQMCYIKDLFWEENETVLQFHPKKSDYVNHHPNILHLWKRIGTDHDLPPTFTV